MKKPLKKKRKKGNRKQGTDDVQPRSGSSPEPKPDTATKEFRVRPSQPVSKKEYERKEEIKKAPLKYIHISTQFLRESRVELKKVKWPTRKELLAATVMVIFLVLVVSFFLGLVDFGLVKLIKNIIG